MSELVRVLMRRAALTLDAAEEVLYDEFGLEPDYVFDLL